MAEFKSKEDVAKAIEEAAEFGMSAVGKREAFEAALSASFKVHKDLYKLINGVVETCTKNGNKPILPLTAEVICLFNDCVCSQMMLSYMMSKNVLDGGEVAGEKSIHIH